jgi:hypothetical protein
MEEFGETQLSDADLAADQNRMPGSCDRTSDDPQAARVVASTLRVTRMLLFHGDPRNSLGVLELADGPIPFARDARAFGTKNFSVRVA